MASLNSFLPPLSLRDGKSQMALSASPPRPPLPLRLCQLGEKEGVGQEEGEDLGGEGGQGEDGGENLPSRGKAGKSPALDANLWPMLTFPKQCYGVEGVGIMIFQSCLTSKTVLITNNALLQRCQEWSSSAAEQLTLPSHSPVMMVSARNQSCKMSIFTQRKPSYIISPPEMLS